MIGRGRPATLRDHSRRGGRYAAAVLADLGADVVKVEDPHRIHDSRLTGPRFLSGKSLYFLALNFRKRSSVVHLSSESGRALVLDLMRWDDVVLNKLRPGVMAMLGLDGDRALSAMDPRLVTCSLAACWETGACAPGPPTARVRSERSAASRTRFTGSLP